MGPEASGPEALYPEALCPEAWRGPLRRTPGWGVNAERATAPGRIDRLTALLGNNLPSGGIGMDGASRRTVQKRPADVRPAGLGTEPAAFGGGLRQRHLSSPNSNVLGHRPKWWRAACPSRRCDQQEARASSMAARSGGAFLTRSSWGNLRSREGCRGMRIRNAPPRAVVAGLAVEPGFDVFVVMRSSAPNRSPFRFESALEQPES